MQTLEIKQKNGRAEGLDEREVTASRAKYGENVLPRAKGGSFFRAFLSNLSDPVIKILLGAFLINLIFLFKS